MGRLLRYLGELGAWRIGLAVALSVLAGLASTAAIWALRRVVAAVTPEHVATFGLALVAFVGCGLASQRTLSGIATRLAAKEQLRVLDRVLRLPLEDIEAVGVGRLRVAFNEDVNVLTNSVVQLPGVVTALVTSGALLVYIGTLGQTLLLATVLASAPFVAVGLTLQFLTKAPQQRSFAAELAMQDLFRLAVAGGKELRLHRGRREHLAVREVVEKADARLRTRTIVNRFGAFGDGAVRAGLLSVVLVGIAVAHGTGLGLDAVTSFVVAAIAMTSSFQNFVHSSRAAIDASVALERIEGFGKELATHRFEDAGDVAPVTTLRSIALRGVKRSYPSTAGDDRAFELGPLDFELRPGEIVFVVGGNGSGKSTFLKVLTGLYPPREGAVLLDGEVVTDVARYRSLFAAVFADFVLFPEAHGAPETLAPLLARLDLAGKVEVRDGRFTTTTALSTGQRKRLALVAALADDRPVFVLDEWASDQDPVYRRFFYTELLPELRARGKAVVCVTHDDEHFGRADRVVQLAEGRIVA